MVKLSKNCDIIYNMVLDNCRYITIEFDIDNVIKAVFLSPGHKLSEFINEVFIGFDKEHDLIITSKLKDGSIWTEFFSINKTKVNFLYSKSISNKKLKDNYWVIGI